MLNWDNAIGSIIQIDELSNACIETSEDKLVLAIEYFYVIFLSGVLQKIVFHVIAQTEMLLFEFSVLFVRKVHQELVVVNEFIVVVKDVRQNAHENGVHVERFVYLESFPDEKNGAIVLRMGFVKAPFKSIWSIKIVVEFKLLSYQKLISERFIQFIVN